MGRFKIKPRGRKHRTIQLDDEGAAAMRAQMEAFREKFGREPGPDDPLIFDPDSDVPKPYPLDRLESEMAEGMAAAGIAPEFIYASRKTGMLPTTENLHLWSEADLAEWEAAIAEYHSLADGTKQ
jgi:hypothetical protein